MPVTIKDIASKSNFSVTTVSRALAGHHDVSEQTRQHITKIAEELGYRPNVIARQLQSQRTNTIGFIMPPHEEYAEGNIFSILIRGMASATMNSNYDILISASQHQPSELEAYARVAGGKRVDGMIVARIYQDDPRLAYLDSIECPYVVFGRNVPQEDSAFNYIDVDSQHGIQLLVTHLVEQGYRDIAIILPPRHVASTTYRLAGYRDALAQFGIPFRESYCSYTAMSVESGRQAAHALLARGEAIDAIIGCTDWMALGALAAAKERGLSVGSTFAVVGYDDIPAARHAYPPLTTIRQPIFEIGAQLTKTLIQLIDEPQPTAEFAQRLIEPQLIVRESSGRQRM